MFNDKEHLENFLRNSDEFVCCMKREVNDDYEFGYILRGLGVVPLVLFLGNAFDPEYKGVKTYDTIDDLLEDGWIVD